MIPLSELYAVLAQKQEEGPLLEREFFLRSEELDRSGLQESFSWRSVHLARLLAQSLIDEKGQLVRAELAAAIDALERASYSLGHNRYHEEEVRDYLLRTLRLLRDDSVYAQTVKRITRPLDHLVCQRLIRETLALPERAKLTDAHARQAVLAAWFTPLRQNVGSCFATAPAILIQQAQPLRFLTDMAVLIGSGRLSRVVQGEEYTVPLSVSWGAGQLLAPLPYCGLEKLVHSPGLREALGENLEVRLAFLDSKLQTPFAVITAEEVIRELLLREYKVTEQDVRDYEEREQLTGSMPMAVPPAAILPKYENIKRYLKHYQEAKNGYKRVTENALLRAWEYTLASFAESKADFATWNLYASLGLNPEEPNGIGSSVRAIIQELLDGIRNEIEEYQSKYDHLFATATYLEGRIKRASEREIGWLTADYQIRRQEIHRLLIERDAAAERGRQLNSFFPFFMQCISAKFRSYFQEVYDAEIRTPTESPYDDCPAGFRLLYKHGRSNTALWTLIYNEIEFIQALTSFFLAIEAELSLEADAVGLREEMSRIITAIILIIKKSSFVAEAQRRLQLAYQDRRRLPWVYISGGTMTTLIMTYYELVDTPKEKKRWVERPAELLAFYIDAMKETPSSLQRQFVEQPHQSMLAYSPTHAFLIRPSLFAEAWDDETYTYTWIRDRLLIPGRSFWDQQKLGEREIHFLIDRLLQVIPMGYRSLVRHSLDGLVGPFSPAELRDRMIQILSYEKWLQRSMLLFLADEIDALSFHHLPLCPDHDVPKRLEMLFNGMPDFLEGQREWLIEEGERLNISRYQLFSPIDVLNLAKNLLLSLLQTTRSPIPFHRKMVGALTKLGFMHPSPLIVGDTNWVKKYLAFVVGPGSRELELWCVDNCGCEGRPLSLWKPYLDGREPKEWGLFIAPTQYGQ